jgi:hypothetical protein
LAELVLKLKYFREEDSMNTVVETYDWNLMILEPLNGYSLSTIPAPAQHRHCEDVIVGRSD